MPFNSVIQSRDYNYIVCTTYTINTINGTLDYPFNFLWSKVSNRKYWICVNLSCQWSVFKVSGGSNLFVMKLGEFICHCNSITIDNLQKKFGIIPSSVSLTWYFFIRISPHKYLIYLWHHISKPGIFHEEIRSDLTLNIHYIISQCSDLLLEKQWIPGKCCNNVSILNFSECPPHPKIILARNALIFFRSYVRNV